MVTANGTTTSPVLRGGASSSPYGVRSLVQEVVQSELFREK